MIGIEITVHPTAKIGLRIYRRLDGGIESNLISQPLMIEEIEAKLSPRPPSLQPSVHQSSQKQRMPYEYEIFNELRRFKTATDCYADCFRTIAYLAPESLEAIAKRLAGPRRNHLARARSLVYPGRPDLAGPAREIAPDWFLGTNIDTAGMKHFMHVACFTAGLEFGVDVKIIKWGRT